MGALSNTLRASVTKARREAFGTAANFAVVMSTRYRCATADGSVITTTMHL